MSFHNSLAIAVSRKYYEYVKADYLDQNGEPILRALEQNIVSSPVEMIMLKV